MPPPELPLVFLLMVEFTTVIENSAATGSASSRIQRVVAHHAIAQGQGPFIDDASAEGIQTEAAVAETVGNGYAAEVNRCVRADEQHAMRQIAIDHGRISA